MTFLTIRLTPGKNKRGIQRRSIKSIPGEGRDYLIPLLGSRDDEKRARDEREAAMHYFLLIVHGVKKPLLAAMCKSMHGTLHGLLLWQLRARH